MGTLYILELGTNTDTGNPGIGCERRHWKLPWWMRMATLEMPFSDVNGEHGDADTVAETLVILSLILDI